jgi:RecJ-like exonuclease
MDFGNGNYGFGNSYWGSNVPCDVPAPMDVEITHYCSECGAKWDVVMDYELGSYFYYDEDNDPLCPECGHDSRYDL